MPRRIPAFAAGVLAALLVLQPAVAWSIGSTANDAGHVDAAESAAHTIALDVDRQVLVQQLVAMGRTLDDAAAAARMLTDQDVAVLIANERMMQEAGASDVYVLAWIGVIVLIGGIVALAIASDSGSLTLF